MMKLYHGTPNRNARAIEVEGFLGSELSDFTTRGAGAGEVVFVTDDIEYASEYGKAIFEIGYIPAERIHYMGEAPHVDAKEYYVFLADLEEFGYWERVQ